MDPKKIKNYGEEFFKALRQFASRFLPFTFWKGLAIPFLLAYFCGKKAGAAFYRPQWAKR